MPDSFPLQPLHPDHTLIPSKLEKYDRLTTDELIDSLKPGQIGSLKARPDGTIINGHHRIIIFRNRGVNVDSLSREAIAKHELNGGSPDEKI